MNTDAHALVQYLRRRTKSLEPISLEMVGGVMLLAALPDLATWSQSPCTTTALHKIKKILPFGQYLFQS
jgi:hypothetical protein